MSDAANYAKAFRDAANNRLMTSFQPGSTYSQDQMTSITGTISALKAVAEVFERIAQAETRTPAVPGSQEWHAEQESRALTGSPYNQGLGQKSQS